MRQCEDISGLIDKVYDAALDPDHWPHALESLTHFFDSSAAHLSIDSHALTNGRLISYGTDPAYTRSYAEYYAARNVLWQRIVRDSIQGVVTNRMIMPTDELRKSEFYNDFLRPQEGEETLCSLSLQHADPTINLVIWRPERFGAWESKHLKLLKMLTPHVRGALRINQWIGGLRLAQVLACEALYQLEQGVILVDAKASVLFANRAAEAIMAGGGLRLDRQRLTAQQTCEAIALDRMIKSAIQSRIKSSVAISRDERPPVLVSALPLKAEVSDLTCDARGAIIFIEDRERRTKPPVARFASHFGLTPAQAALTHELMKGDGLTAAAKRLGVSHSTVRTHLHQIFQKTATRRQAELVRLILEWADAPAFAGKASAAEQRTNSHRDIAACVSDAD